MLVIYTSRLLPTSLNGRSPAAWEQTGLLNGNTEEGSQRVGYCPVYGDNAIDNALFRAVPSTQTRSTAHGLSERDVANG